MCSSKILLSFLYLTLYIGNVLTLPLLPVENNAVDYDGYSVLFIKSKSKDENKLVFDLIRDNVEAINVWSTTKSSLDGLETIISIPPYLKADAIEILQINNIEFEILIDNVKKIFEEEQNNQLYFVDKGSGYISFDHYYRHGQINDYLDRLARDYPNLVEVIQIGNSYENRTIKMIKVSSTSESSSSSKPAVFVEGGIHAREWIAPAQVLYIINQLVENYENNTDLLENLDWYLIPVVNPDGYEYTHEKDRLWRRTRSKVVDIPFYTNYLAACRLTATPCSCVGVDANRNWDIYWDGSPENDNEIVIEDGMHSNGHIPCLDDYGGPKPFSEIEVKQLSDFAKTIKHQIKLYLSFHSFGNKILYPYGYTTDLPSNADELDSLGHLVAKSMSVKYSVGSSANILYGLTGGSADYFHDRLKVGLSYTVELPGGGHSGFDLPPNRIQYIVSDMFKGVRTFANYVKNKFSKSA